MLNEPEWQALNIQWATARPELAGGWMPAQECVAAAFTRRRSDGPGITDLAWKCDTCSVVLIGEATRHIVPPPDMRDGATFLRVLTESKDVNLWCGGNKVWYCHLARQLTYRGDTPPEALARALAMDKEI